jgi:putative ATP-dependent endonuclease of the OLD family
MLHGTQIRSRQSEDLCRFRPKRIIRDALARKEIEEDFLTLEGYSRELVGDGNPAIDLKDIEWNDENDVVAAASQIGPSRTSIVRFPIDTCYGGA